MTLHRSRPLCRVGVRGTHHAAAEWRSTGGEEEVNPPCCARARASNYARRTASPPDEPMFSGRDEPIDDVLGCGVALHQRPVVLTPLPVITTAPRSACRPGVGIFRRCAVERDSTA